MPRTRSQHPFRNLAVYMRTLRIVHIALILGVVLFAAVVLGLALAQPDERMLDELGQTLLFAVAATFTAIVVLGLALFGGRAYHLMMRGREAGSIQVKLQCYFASRILLAALCEGPALLWCVLCLLTRQPLYLAGAAVCLVLMLLRFPTEQNLEDTVGMRPRAIDEQLQSE